jgi:subtilisin family serine protease
MKALIPALLLLPVLSIGQVRNVDSLEKKHLNWHNLDNAANNVMGTSVEKAWVELLNNRQSKKTIIVAIIDSGIDIDHEDLKESIWVNEDEIPDNNIDDDHNGFVDDIHGWNFIGNSKGENINFENMEFTRIYRAGESHPNYQSAKALYLAELEKQNKQKTRLEEFEKAYWNAKTIIKEKTGITANTLKDLDAISSDAPQEVFNAKRFLAARFERGFNDVVLQEVKQTNSDYLNYFLNVDFDARKVIGDNPAALDGVYGNPDVEGPRADHGTGVAGVIAAKRNNSIGIDGIAQDVKIMCLRSTPRGDERDKDVANAIRYAVDNGARIINMSFGKPLSPEKQLVDDAVRYAEQKNVLLVHGSGNDGKNIDKEQSYPSDRYLNDMEATNWINVGASDAVADETLPAIFSNYGEKHVDIFAPGVNIISLDSGSTYNMHDGTSLSAPIVSGVAALILSYHPQLTPTQLIDLLLQSSTKMDKLKVLEPGFGEEREKSRFKELSKSGGVLNAYEALKKADKLYGSQ